MPLLQRCLVDDDGCLGAVPPGAPVALCEGHLSWVAEWCGARDGETDALPSPCRLCGSRLGVRYASGWLCAVCEWRHGEVPDGELAPPRVDVVYYVRYRERVKIGTTANPHRRLAAIRHDEVLAFERGDRALEQRRHTQFAVERYDRTEWFRLTAALQAHIDTLATGTPDPWARYTRWMSEAIALRG